MSKELIERLRSNFPTTQAQWEAADRIEELERAVEFQKKAWTADLAENDALLADNARMWEAIRDFLMEWDNCRSSGEWPVRRFAAIREALTTTPEQSLARIRNQVREEAAKLAEKHDSYILATEIRAMKEPE